MHNLLPIACFALLTSITSIGAQTGAPAPIVEIPVVFPQEPAKPLFIQGANGRTIVFFYPASMPYDDDYPCQAVEMDTTSGMLRRIGPTGKIHVAWGWKQAPAPLGGYQDNRAAYAWLLDQNILTVARIDHIDLSVRAETRLKLKNPDEVLGLVGRGDHGLLLLREKRRGNKSVIKVVRLEGDSIGATREIPAGHLPGLFSKDFKPAVAASNVVSDPAQAAYPYRLFDAGEVIRITHDGRFGPDGLETAYLLLYTVDLKQGSVTLDKLPYLPKGVETGIAAHGASYIVDGKLFQVYVTHANWNLLVRDLDTRVVLHHESIGPGDSLPAFNTPVRIPKNFLQVQKSTPVETFLAAHMETMPYIVVTPAPDGYRLLVGGSKIAKNDIWALALLLPKAVAVPVLLNHWSRQNSFSLCKVLDVHNLKSLPTPNWEQSFFEACDQISDDLGKGRRAQTVFRLGNRHLMGAYTPKSGLYGFYEVK